MGIKTISNHILGYNQDMDIIAELYIYFIYGLLGLSGLGLIWGIKELIWPGDK